MEIKALASELVERIKATSPLIHNITNFVVMNATANILLALGASPVMAHCLKEVEEMAGMADALVLNIGTLQEDWVDAMILAGKTANRKGIPVILDPVGSGATKFRTDTVRRIISEVAISVLRGNASEIFSLSDTGVKTRGVDSSLGLNPEMANAIQTLARDLNCIIAVSGAEDIITNGRDMFTVANGQPVMTRVTGIGCGLTAVVGAFCAVGGNDLLTATATAFGVYGLCGDLAINISPKPGSFFTAFVDALYDIRAEDIQAGLRVAEVSEDLI